MIEINVPKEVTEKIEKYDIQYHSRQEIISEILKNNNELPLNNLLIEYQKDYDEKYFLFQKEKQKIEEKYVKPNVKTDNYIWHLNYYTNVLTIQE